MLKYFFLVATLFVGFSGLAQTTFNKNSTLDRIGKREMGRMPKGTLVTFEQDLFMAAQEYRTSIVAGCWFGFNSHMVSEFDQVIRAGVQKPIINTDTKIIFFHENVYIYCDAETSIENLVKATQGILKFEFPASALQDFVFP